MFHLVARSIDRSLLFRDWTEARALWARVLTAAPSPTALVLMPDHLHLLHRTDARRPLAAALSGYARWRNAHRCQRGPVFEALPPAEEIVDDDKRRRSVRYVHLNPCRAKLVADPLGWPFSTHRDAVGLSAPAALPLRRDPAAFHRYVSSDPSVDVNGTELPATTLETDDVLAVFHAVSAVTRTPLSDMIARGPARTLFLGVVDRLCPRVPRRVVAELCGVRRQAAIAASARPDPRWRTIAGAVGDTRFLPLRDGDLTRLPGWERYRGRG